MLKQRKYFGHPVDPQTGQIVRTQYLHIVGGPKTGAIYSDAVRQNVCPKCKSEPGFHCLRPNGRLAWPPHLERCD